MNIDKLEIVCGDNFEDCYSILGDDVIRFQETTEKTLLRLNNKNYTFPNHRTFDDRTPTFLERMNEWNDIKYIRFYYSTGNNIPYHLEKTYQKASVDRGGSNIVLEIYH
jgi:hypothetical protein